MKSSQLIKATHVSLWLSISFIKKKTVTFRKVEILSSKKFWFEIISLNKYWVLLAATLQIIINKELYNLLHQARKVVTFNHNPITYL